MSSLPWPINSAGNGLGEGATLVSPPSKPMVQSGEPLTSGVVNRGTWALAQDVDHIWERMTSEGHPLAITESVTHTTSADETGYGLLGDIYVGQATTALVSDIFKLYDNNGVLLKIGGVAVTVSSVTEGKNGPSVFRYSGGFFTDSYLKFSQTIPSGTEYTIKYGVKTDLESLDVEGMFFLPDSGEVVVKKYSSVADGIEGTSPGELFYVSSGGVPTRFADSKQWDTSISLTGTGTEFGEVEMESNGSDLVVADLADKKIYIYNAKTGELRATVTTPDIISAIAIGDTEVYAALESDSTSAIYSYSLSDGSESTIYPICHFITG